MRAHLEHVKGVSHTLVRTLDKLAGMTDVMNTLIPKEHDEASARGKVAVAGTGLGGKP